MAKGFFTQGIVILLKESIVLDELENLLREFTILKRSDEVTEWAFGGPTLVIEYDKEVNGTVSVDVTDRKWPDHMGDPKGESMLFGAWSMGHFGPYAYPNGLTRAGQQCWSWSDGKSIVSQHNAFIRIRLSYIFGAGRDASVMPKGCDPQKELAFISDIALALLRHPQALCYFNPSGEVLKSTASLKETLEYHRSHDLPPLSAWVNVRLFNIDEGWTLMDSVGNWQLDIPDLEVAFPKGFLDPQDVDYFIRNATLYILKNGQVIKNGDTMDGPSDCKLQAWTCESGLSDPPREVLRWIPTSLRDIPKQILPKEEETGKKKKKFWKLW